MTLGVRGKLFLLSLALILVVGATSAVVLEGSLRDWLESRIEASLLRHAAVGRDLLERVGGEATIAGWNPLAARLGRSTDARITLIARDGTVVGDSELSDVEVRSVENHASRPEVQQALGTGHGLSRRYSTTLRTRMMYAAVTYGSSAGSGVVRAAMPLAEVDAALARLRWLLFFAGLLGLGVAVLMSGFASHLVTRTVRTLVQEARALAQGELAPPLAVRSSDELRGLAGSMNRLAGELAQTVSALASERDRLHTILESMTEGVVALDAEHRVTLANGSAQKLMPLDSAPVGSLLLEAVRVPALAHLVHEAEKGQDVAIEFDMPARPVRRVYGQAAGLRASGGCVIVLHDVTEMRRLESMRRDFVANVSHELRTPVTVIRANVETLLNGALDERERARRFLEAIDRNAERLARLVSDLLDLSSIEAGHYGLQPRPAALGPVVAKAIEATETLAAPKDVRLVHHVPAGLEVVADERAVEQVLLNLLENAVKHTPRGRCVSVKAEAAQGHVRVEVLDEGPGIEPQHRERIFERFYRVDQGRSLDKGGTGLGLAIVKHLVLAMGGEVAMQPASGGGAAFWFSLPTPQPIPPCSGR